MPYPPGSIERVEFIQPNPKIREDFEVNIRTLVSILNSNNLDRDTMVLVNEKIRYHIQGYHNPVMIIKEG
jgi:GTPase SAR1 family protein